LKKEILSLLTGCLNNITSKVLPGYYTKAVTMLDKSVYHQDVMMVLS